MEINQYRVVAVGANTPDILSEVTQTLSMQNYEIDTVSSLRLGHSNVVVCIIEAAENKYAIRNCLQNVIEKYCLKLIIDKCELNEFTFIKSDAYMRLKGNHEAGIKAYIISELISTGLDIHGLESESYEENGAQQFLMNIKGQATKGIESLSSSVDKLNKQGIEAGLATDWKLLA